MNLYEFFKLLKSINSYSIQIILVCLAILFNYLLINTSIKNKDKLKSVQVQDFYLCLTNVCVNDECFDKFLTPTYSKISIVSGVYDQKNIYTLNIYTLTQTCKGE